MERTGRELVEALVATLNAGETASWSKPFPAPEWRAQWVERI